MDNPLEARGSQQRINRGTKIQNTVVFECVCVLECSKNILMKFQNAKLFFFPVCVFVCVIHLI